MVRLSRITLLPLLLLLFSSLGWGAHVGDVISNTAHAAYTIDGDDRNLTTNEVNLTVAQTPATIEFLAIDPDGAPETLQPTTYEGSGGTTAMPPATLPDGTVVPTPSDINASATSQYGQRDLVLIRVRDLDQDTDADTQQVIDINITNPRTGEIETLHLMESGPNTGVFVGYIHTKPCPAGMSSDNTAVRMSADVDHRDGAICVTGGDKITAVYVDNGTHQTLRVEADARIVEEEFALLVTKAQSKDVASIGEYLQYTVTAENIGKASYRNVTITDRLPDGVKYVPGSFKVEATSITPTLSSDGKTLSYIHPALAKGATVTLTYVAVIGAGTVDHQAVNTAWASAPGAGKSNVAKTVLKIKEELWRSKGFILGQVYEADAPCEHNATKGVGKGAAVPASSVVGLDGKPHPERGCGIEGVKLYMEDGRYVTTDKDGRYHFVDVANGTHVVQIDDESIKGRYTIEQCERTTRFAGRARSQFVEVHHGGLNRADFCLRRIPGATGNALLEMHITQQGKDRIRVTLRTNASMTLIDPEVFLSLSDGLGYVKGSTTTDKEPIRHDDILVVKMGDKREASLTLKVTDNIIPDKELRAILYYDTETLKDQHSEVADVMFMTAKGKAEVARITKITQASDRVLGESVGAQVPAGDYNWTKPTHQVIMLQYTPKEVDDLGAKPAIVWPPKGWIPDIPSTRVAILYPKGHSVELRLNGHKVSALNYEGLFRGTKGMQVMHYKGVDLAEGLNTFTVIVKKGKRVIQRLTRTVYVESRSPKTITFLPKYSYLEADGTHEPIVAVKMLGPSGHPLRGGMVGSFTTDGAHQPAQMSNGKGSYTIDSQGIAYVRLKPTAIAGEATLTFSLYGDRSQTLRVRLKPHLRPWIVVGFAEGTIGYRTLSGNAEGLDHQHVKKGLYIDGRLAFFAKGRIKGDWLLTMAFDSGRKKGDRKLFDSIDPNAYYTIYQDATHQGNEAPSTKKLYLKLEKGAYTYLFGDYHTAIKGGEFTSYNRDFTGGRAEYRGANVETVVFAAKTDKLHYRDALRGDGTRGYYTLTHTPLIEGSEAITLEVRDRHRPEIVLESKPLERWHDYTIDYDTGKLYFKEPIYSTDRQFNPRTIVATYDVEGDGKKYYTYGGRASYTTDDRKLQIGATAIRQEHGDGADMLGGVDGTLKLGERSELHAEYALTRSTHEANTSIGHAYKVGWKYTDDNTSLRAYWRYQDAAFGLGNLPEVLSATRKIGLDATHRIDTHWSLNGSIYQNRRFDANGTYTDEFVLQPTLSYTDINWSASIGYRYAKNTATAATNQLTLKLSRYFLDRKLKLSLGHDQSLGANEDQEFPTRTTFGADYKVDENTSLFGSLERSDSNGRITWRSRMGATYKPWKGGEIKLSRLMDATERGFGAYDTFGLSHHWDAGKHWKLSAGYEKGIAEHNATRAGFDAFNLAARYEGERLSGDGSIGLRREGADKKLNVDLGLYIRKDKNLGLAFGVGYHTRWNATDLHRDIDAKLAFAWRDEMSPWIALDRMDYIDRYDRTVTDETRTRKLINNFAAIYHTDHWEIGLQYGLKYTLDTIDGVNYGGWVDLLGLDATYNLNDTWAIGAQGSILHAYGAGNMDYSGGVYVETTPWENAKLTLGYNIAGFADEDFSAQNYRHKGPYIQVKMKFDQEDIKKVVEGVVK